MINADRAADVTWGSNCWIPEMVLLRRGEQALRLRRRRCCSVVARLVPAAVALMTPKPLHRRSVE